VGGQFLLGAPEQRKLVDLLFPLARFCGVEVITYCMMSNHFHLLLRIPTQGHLSDQTLLQRAEAFYGRDGLLPSLAREDLRQSGSISNHLRQTLSSRMGDVSAFMKEFKQRFSRWFNRQSDRFGTLWAERFSSTLVEDSPQALQTVASYIDLNPVRAGLVSDPKDYPFCGYSAALAGQAEVRRGLMSFLAGRSWNSAAAEYRHNLFTTAGAAGHSDKQALDRDAIRAELARGGHLSPPEILRLRLRHLTAGVAIGSKEFVNRVFHSHRSHFGPRRLDGARPIRAVPLPHLNTLRDLRVRAVG
jgi:REP element-mobilizing transposase RayT